MRAGQRYALATAWWNVGEGRSALPGEPAQQPLSETTGTTLVRFTEPPSVVGTAGPQIGPPAPPAEDAPAEDDVVLAALDDDESGASPGSCNGV